MLTPDEHEFLEKFFENSLRWRRIRNVEEIIRLENHKFPSRDKKRQMRNYLLNDTSSYILMILALTGKQLTLSELIETFRDLEDDYPEDGYNKRKAYERTRSRLLRLLENLREYELVDLQDPKTDKRKLSNSRYSLIVCGSHEIYSRYAR